MTKGKIKVTELDVVYKENKEIETNKTKLKKRTNEYNTIILW